MVCGLDPLPACVCPVQQGGGHSKPDAICLWLLAWISQLLGLSRVSIQTLQAILTRSQGAEGPYGPIS